MLYIFLFPGLPEFTQVAIVSTTVGVVYFILLIHFRRLLMRVLLKYRRWMCKFIKSFPIVFM